MISLGYLYKFVGAATEMLRQNNVVDIHTLGDCGGNPTLNFADYINFWEHNGYWLFDTPETIVELATENKIDLSSATLFYYEAHELEFDIDDNDKASWTTFTDTDSLPTAVKTPTEKKLSGFDVTEFVMHNSPECSLLACTNISSYFPVNSYCLFDTFEQAKTAMESGIFHEHEPGPYRIIAVYHIPANCDELNKEHR